MQQHTHSACLKNCKLNRLLSIFAAKSAHKCRCISDKDNSQQQHAPDCSKQVKQATQNSGFTRKHCVHALSNASDMYLTQHIHRAYSSHGRQLFAADPLKSRSSSIPPASLMACLRVGIVNAHVHCSRVFGFLCMSLRMMLSKARLPGDLAKMAVYAVTASFLCDGALKNLWAACCVWSVQDCFACKCTQF